MKRTIILTMLLVVLFTGCGYMPPEIPTLPTIAPLPEETPEPISPEVISGEVVLALYDGENLKFWDGNMLTNGYTGVIKKSGPRKISIDNVLYYMDEYGASIHSRWLPGIPAAVLVVPNESKASTIYEDDIYTLIDIPPDEAYAAGARYKHYTRVFKNGIEIGQWNLNEYEVVSVIETASGHIIAQDSMKHWHNLTDNKVIYNAFQDGLMFYNVDDVAMYGSVTDADGDYSFTWGDGFFHHSRWQKAGNTYYSENGFIWRPGITFIEPANEMYGWNKYETYHETYDGVYGERPYLLPSGVYTENGEEVTYWIETVTGHLYRHIPSIDNLDYIIDVYEGLGYRMDAIPYFNTLKPEVIGDDLFYHADGMIRTVDLKTKMVHLFGKDQEVISWE